MVELEDHDVRLSTINALFRLQVCEKGLVDSFSPLDLGCVDVALFPGREVPVSGAFIALKAISALTRKAVLIPSPYAKVRERFAFPTACADLHALNSTQVPQVREAGVEPALLLDPNQAAYHQALSLKSQDGRI